jgi:hypothetical protein
MSTACLVKTAEQPSSQSLPMLTRLLVNPGMMWPWRAVSDGKVGMFSCAAAVDVMRWPVAVLMVMVGAAVFVPVTHALGMK